MPIVINGSGTVTGISAGGLPDGVVDLDTLAANSVNAAKIVDGTIVVGDIADDAVTYAKMQNVSADERILGRISGADGVIEELTKAQVLTFANVEDGADVTDATNVTAAGALMDSECAGLAAVKATTGTFLTADQTKLDAIEASATADQSNAEIRTAVEAASDSNVFTDADHSKLNGIAK